MKHIYFVNSASNFSSSLGEDSILNLLKELVKNENYKEEPVSNEEYSFEFVSECLDRIEKGEETARNYEETIEYMFNFINELNAEIEELLQENSSLFEQNDELIDEVNGLVKENYEVCVENESLVTKYENLSTLFDVLLCKAKELNQSNIKLEEEIDNYKKFESYARSVLEGADIMLDDYNAVVSENEKLKQALYSLGYRVS